MAIASPEREKKSMSRTPAPRWATRKQAAEYAAVGLTTIDQWVTDGKIARYGTGHMVRLDLNEIDAFYRSNVSGKKAS